MNKKIYGLDLLEKRRRSEPIAMVTAYDFPSARLVDRAGVDVILVGDSLGVVVQGDSGTLSVTLDEMIYHTKLVTRGVKHALVVADLPFLSYQIGENEAILAAGRLIKEARAEAVKLEGGRVVASTIKRLVESGIPVMGHLGLTPQSVNHFGGYRVQGKCQESQERMLEDAHILELAGVFAIVLECIPEGLGRQITESLSVPTIGIGAGRYCSGQVLVFHDLVGYKASEDQHQAKFVKCFADVSSAMLSGLERFVEEVRTGEYPGKNEVYDPLE